MGTSALEYPRIQTLNSIIKCYNVRQNVKLCFRGIVGTPSLAISTYTRFSNKKFICSFEGHSTLLSFFKNLLLLVPLSYVFLLSYLVNDKHSPDLFKCYSLHNKNPWRKQIRSIFRLR
jgi:hypothetical protein